jgi:hypothetical protein
MNDIPCARCTHQQKKKFLHISEGGTDKYLKKILNF